MATAVVVVGVGGIGVKGTTVAMARWTVSLASATLRSDQLARVCEGTVDTVNVGSRALICLILILCCVRGDPVSQKY
jgi:hypothetical protein